MDTKPKSIPFSQLNVGDKFKLDKLDIRVSIGMKIDTIYADVNNPLLWHTLGKKTKYNVVCIKTKLKGGVGVLVYVEEDQKVIKINEVKV